jgi:hypothetical protein
MWCRGNIIRGIPDRKNKFLTKLLARCGKFREIPVMMDSELEIEQFRRTSKYSKPMGVEDFFQALFAALLHDGVKSIDTRDGQHQERFQRVAEYLDEHAEAADRLGVCFFPSPYNGRFAEFDSELLKQQVGLLGAQNPFYPGVHLQFSQETADAILNDLAPEDRIFFEELSRRFQST